MSDLAREPDPLEMRLKRGNVEALAVLFSQHRERLWRMVNFRMDRRLFGRVDPTTCFKQRTLPLPSDWPTTTTSPRCRRLFGCEWFSCKP